MKFAYYSPLPPSRSGIADYSTLLLPALRERLDVVVAEPGKRAPAADVALYHVGNDPDAHGWIVDALRERPGVVVLHEYVLHHLIAGITIGRGDGRGYLDAMERDGGVPARLLGLGVLDNLLPLIWETQPERFPLNICVLGALLSVASIVGNSVGYYVGKLTGPHLFNRENSLLFNKKHLIKAHEFYERHGGKTIIIARFMPIVRTFVPVVAGMAQMEYRRYTLYNNQDEIDQVSSLIITGSGLITGASTLTVTSGAVMNPAAATINPSLEF